MLRLPAPGYLLTVTACNQADNRNICFQPEAGQVSRRNTALRCDWRGSGIDHKLGDTGIPPKRNFMAAAYGRELPIA